MHKNTQYVALLRGINVGGNHKLPMADLKKEMAGLGYEKVTTLLNSGNVVFETSLQDEKDLEVKLAIHLEKVFGFPVPVLIRSAAIIKDLVKNNPFENIELTKDIRLYISFLKDKPKVALSFPWVSSDGSFQILETRDKTICSVLDLAVTQTPKGMDALEQLYGKNITTRNWNTIQKIAEKLTP